MTRWRMGREPVAYLAASVHAADSTIQVDRPLSGDSPYFAIVTEHLVEHVKLSGFGPDWLEVVRGVNQTCAFNHLVGAPVYVVWPVPEHSRS